MRCNETVLAMTADEVRMNTERRRYVDSEDDDGEDSVEVKRTKRSSRTANKQKEAAAGGEQRSRQNADDAAGAVTRRDDSRTAGGRSGRLSLSKENICIDKDKQAILEVISKLSKHRQSWPFLEPVDANEVPDYYEIVKKPVDLATMEGRCISDLYTTPQKFVDEFALMMNNAVQYNTVDSVVCKCIGPFEKYFEVIIDRFLPGCKYRRRVRSSI